MDDSGWIVCDSIDSHECIGGGAQTEKEVDTDSIPEDGLVVIADNRDIFDAVLLEHRMML